MNELFSIAGKVAVITGAGGVLGGNIAQHFVQQGAKVVAIDIRQEQLDNRVAELKQYGQDVIGIIGDVLDIASLEKVAEETGTYIYLEPLNRYQDHMLNTLEDAVGIIDKGGFKRVKITADFYHMAIEEDDISESLRKYKDYIGHIHIAENHRYQPGTGSIDWARHMKTLKEIGYEGPVVNEGRIRGEDPLKVYQESVDFMKQFM